MKKCSRNEKVNRLLHDAEHAESGRRMAEMMGDGAAAARFNHTCRNLISEAKALDPEQESEWWKDAEVLSNIGWRMP